MKPMVFLHGWAQSQQIWFQQRQIFPDALFLNLPGHGGAADLPPEQWVEYLANQLPDEPCVLVGWSLGGMLGLEISRLFPDRISALALVATTPCFRQQTDWLSGCDEALFGAFELAVSSASPKLLNRFFGLMLHGDGLNRNQHNALAKQAVDRDLPVSTSGLRGGLTLLASLDNRHALATLSMPALVLHGEHDAIVSADSARWLAESLSNNRLHLFADCGHAPFLTQADTFNTQLHNWWQTL